MTSNIMIIDDSPIDRRIIRKVLENRLEDIQIFEIEEGINLNKNLSSNNIHMELRLHSYSVLLFQLL